MNEEKKVLCAGVRERKFQTKTQKKKMTTSVAHVALGHNHFFNSFINTSFFCY